MSKFACHGRIRNSGYTLDVAVSGLHYGLQKNTGRHKILPERALPHYCEHQKFTTLLVLELTFSICQGCAFVRHANVSNIILCDFSAKSSVQNNALCLLESSEVCEDVKNQQFCYVCEEAVHSLVCCVWYHEVGATDTGFVKQSTAVILLTKPMVACSQIPE